MEFEGELPKQRAFAVEYPGHVQNVRRMVDTLGGEAAIAEARTNNAPLLELRFRPADPLSHPLFGDVHPTTSNLLLKITRTRKRPVASESVAAKEGGSRHAEAAPVGGGCALYCVGFSHSAFICRSYILR